MAYGWGIEVKVDRTNDLLEAMMGARLKEDHIGSTFKSFSSSG